MEDIVRKVVAHEVAIEHMVSSIERLADTAERTNDKLDHLVEAAGQTSVILERIANIDTNNRDSVNRLHKRIDETLLELHRVELNANKGSKVHDFLTTSAKVLAVAIPVITVIAGALLWVIQHA